MEELFNYDKENMREVVRDWPKMFNEAKEFGKDLKFNKKDIDKIIVVGMGGSGMVGDLLRNTFFSLDIPIFIKKGYELPGYINEKTLIFIVSYSGNTEETLSVFNKAVEKGYKKIVAITSGGEILDICKENNLSYVKIPSGIQPRLSTPYLYSPIINILHNSGIIEDPADSFEATIESLNKEGFEEKGRDLAKKLVRKIPLVYASNKNYGAALIWKCEINENAKTSCFFNVFPEFNHNETNALIKPNGDFHAILLKDVEDHDRIKKRFRIIKELIKKSNIDVTEILISNSNKMARIFTSIYLGIWASYYLALYYRIDPTPVPIIEDLKVELKKDD